MKSFGVAVRTEPMLKERMRRGMSGYKQSSLSWCVCPISAEELFRVSR